jgi:hypothetical protein
VEEIGALRDFVLDNLYVGSQNALFGMGFWMCSIVDIRMVSLVVALCTNKVHGFSHNYPFWQIADARDTPRPIAVGSGNLPKRLLSYLRVSRSCPYEAMVLADHRATQQDI